MSRARQSIAAGAIALIGVAIWWSTREAPLPPEGPLPVATDTTVQQIMPDAEGKPEVWTLSKREMEREQLPDLVLPASAPRESPPGPHTDSARALDAQALEAWKHGDIELALELFEAAIEADPDDALPRLDYGRLLMLMTAHDEAWPHLERAAELEPENPQVWVDLLSFYDKNQLLERATYARDRAEALADGRPLIRDETGLWVIEGNSVKP